MNFLRPDQAQELAEVLERAKSIGLLGPGPVEDHIEHAQKFFSAIGEPPEHALDLGSGGGVPGLVLAIAWPDSRWKLLDAAQKRIDFLGSAIEELGLTSRVTTLQGRAEELARDASVRQSFDLVTARGFGPPATTAECASGFLKTGGQLCVSEPPELTDRWPAEGLAILGMEISEPRKQSVAIIRQSVPCDEKFPRRDGVPRKRPLF